MGYPKLANQVGQVCRILAAGLAILWGSCCVGNGQKTLRLSIDHYYDLGIDSEEYTLHVSVSERDSLYFLGEPPYGTKKSLLFGKVNLRTGEKRMEKLSLPKSIVKQIYIWGFAVSEQDMLILLSKQVLLFHKTKGEWIYQKTLDIHPYDFYTVKSRYPDKGFVLSKSYNSHPADSKFRETIGIYIPNEDSIRIIHREQLPGVAFSHRPGKRFEVLPTAIVRAETLKYRIHLWDKEGNKINMLSRDIPGWSTPDEIPVEYDLSKIEAKRLIMNLHRLDSSYYRIEHIFPIDDSLLGVAWFKTGEYYTGRMLDVWDLKSGKALYTDVYYQYATEWDTIEPSQWKIWFSESSDFLPYHGDIIMVKSYHYFPQEKTTWDKLDKKVGRRNAYHPRYSLLFLKMHIE